MAVALAQIQWSVVDWQTVIAALALLATVVLWAIERRARKAEAAEDTELLKAYRAGVVRVQEQLAEIVLKLAVQGAGTGGDPDEGSANITARLDANQRLVVSNRGPGRAEVRDVQIIGDPNAIPAGQGVGDGVELLPDEQFTLVLALTFATPHPIVVSVAWTDGTGNAHRREIRV